MLTFVNSELKTLSFTVFPISMSDFDNDMFQVNIIVATSILEEGLDVQSCNLVIRFDPCSTVCSFIQSKGRARMENSDYVLMVER